MGEILDNKQQAEHVNHVLAYNPYRKGCMGSIYSQPLTEYDKTIHYGWVKELVAQIRGEKPIKGVDMNDAKALAKEQEKLKKCLPFRAAYYYHFQDNKRRQDHIDPQSFLFQVTVDVDEKDQVEKALQMAKILDKEDWLSDGKNGTKPNPWKGKLLHLEYSARKKLHIDVRMPIGMTIEETQRAYCKALGVPCDESCFSPERIIFITDADSEIYRAEGWYAVLPDDELAKRRKAFTDRGLTIDGRAQATTPNTSNTKHYSLNINTDVQDHRLSGSDSHHAVSAGAAVQPAQSNISHPADDAHLSAVGNPQNAGAVAATQAANERNLATSQQASEKGLILFDLFKQQAGLGAVNIDTEGSRHSSLLAIMSAGASRVMSEDELRNVVAVKMPSFYNEHDCQQLIHDFYTKYGDSSKPMSRDVIRINALAEQQVKLGVRSEKLGVSSEKLGVRSEKLEVRSENLGASLSAAQANHNFQPSTFNLQLPEEAYPDPPAMPEHLPKLVELLISKTPDVYKPAVANAIFPPLATHLWHTTFRYIDNVEHEATLMCCLMAGSGAGKSCVDRPISYIMADIRERDRENLKREKEWKDEVTRKGANKDKRKRPDNLVIQEIDADMTNPAFVMRTSEAQDHFLYTSLNEIDLFDALKGQGNQQFRIMCLAFDPHNQFGQTRVGTQSVTERVTIRFNWNASTTIHKGQRYFSKVLTDGPISRINLCTIPEREIGADMPVYGTYDLDYEQALKPYIENLCKASGVIDCAEAYQLALKLREENNEFARMSQNRVYENLSFRANVIAYLKACVLYVANGCQWEPEIEDFIRWSEQYDLYCKMRFFGDAIARAENEGVKSSKRGPKNLLQDLPDEFSIQQAVEIRLRNGLNAEGTRIMVNAWTHRGYIKRVERNATSGNDNYRNDSFIKLRYRKDGAEMEKN